MHVLCTDCVVNVCIADMQHDVLLLKKPISASCHPEDCMTRDEHSYRGRKCSRISAPTENTPALYLSVLFQPVERVEPTPPHAARAAGCRTRCCH